MTNKMNIDMGDFFGGGEAPLPAKKDVPKSTSRFGFGMITSRKSASRLSFTKPGGNEDSFDNPLAGTNMSSKAPTKVPPNNKLAASPIVSGQKSIQLGAQSDSKSPSSKNMTHAESRPKSTSASQTQTISAPKTPLPNPPMKGSQGTILPVVDQAQTVSRTPDMAISTVDKGAPPPLPPRKLSPRSIDTSSMPPPSLKQGNGSMGSIPVPSSPVAASLPASASPLQTTPSATISAPPVIPSATSSILAHVPVATVNSIPVSIPVSPSKPDIPSSLPKPLEAEKEGMAKSSSSGASSSIPTQSNNELRAQIAPWTVWAEDPTQTLANEDLRSQIAPWTTEPEPEPSRKRSTLVPKKSSEEKPADKNIAIDQFYSGGQNDDDFGDDDEFVNPLLASSEIGDKDEEGTISMASIRKKTLARGSQAPVKESLPIVQKGVEKPRIENKKAIDYGQVFKTAAPDDDDSNALINDPEFRDAPDFEW